MQKLFSYFITAIALIFLQACNTHADTDKNVSKLAGHYVYGHEVNAFQPCNQKEASWVTGPEKLLSHISAEHSRLTTKPYEKVFLIFNGRYTGKATDGFAMDYNGQVAIKKLIKIRKASENDCKSYK